jgi:hypothetical protein
MPALQVRVLGEGYTPDDEEDSAVAEVANVFVYQVSHAPRTSQHRGGAMHTECTIDIRRPVKGVQVCMAPLRTNGPTVCYGVQSW